MCRLMAYYNAPYTSSEIEDFYKIQGATHRDASGLALFGPFGRVWVTKAPVPGPTFWVRRKQSIADRLRDSTMGLFHVRHATHGSPLNNQNNHPIYHLAAGKLDTMLIHNGIVTPSHVLPIQGQTDSEQLLVHYEQGGFPAWEEFTGFAAVVMYSAGNLYCYRSGAPLYWRTVGNGVQLTQTPMRWWDWDSVPSSKVFRVSQHGLIPVCNVTFHEERHYWFHNNYYNNFSAALEDFNN